MGRLGIVVLFVLVMPAPVGAQVMERVCYPGNGNFPPARGRALSLEVDNRSQAHVLHVNEGGGGLYHTVVDAIDGAQDTQIDRLVRRAPTNELSNVDLRLFDGVPHICYHDAPSDVFRVGWLDGDEWVLEQLDEGEGVGDACALFRAGGQLRVLYRRVNRLSVAIREGVDQWRIEDVDNIGSVGHEVQLTELANGSIVAVHRDDTAGQLRVSWRSPNGDWRNETVLWQNPAGLRPRIIPSGDTEVRIFHGAQNAMSDGGLIMVQGSFGDFDSSILLQGEGGGSTGAALMSGRSPLLVTREMRRNAVFGNFDGLRLYRELPANESFQYLERWDHNAARHTFDFIDLAADPFGMPVIALKSGPQNEGEHLCFWRAADGDNDRLPDMVEAWTETDPENPDTDGDGRLDGDEAMEGDNPAGAGPLRPGILMADGNSPPMEPDMGMPPVMEPDAGLVLDAGLDPPDAMVPLDADVVDSASVDATPAPPIDGATEVDAVAPDQGRPPRPAPDASVPDTEVPVFVDATIDGESPPADATMAPANESDDGGCSTGDAPPSPWAILLLLVVAGCPRRPRGRRHP